MTCREFAEFLDSFLAGALPFEQAQAFKSHLAVCRDCVVYLEGYQRTVEACRQLREAEKLPAEVPDELVQAILAAQKEHG